MFVRRLKTFFPIILVIVSIAGLLTFVLTWIGTGFHGAFMSTWIRSFIPTACLLAPTAIFATFLLSRVVEFFFEKRKPFLKKIILAIMMGCTIEFFVSLLTTINSVGLFSSQFFGHWMQTYIHAIPLGICVGLFMSFIFKPWMHMRISRLEKVA